MRTVGLLLIAAALMLAGLFAAEQRRRKSRQRHGFLSLFEKIRFQIEHFSKEQAALFESLSVPALEQDFLPLVRREVEADPVLALQRALAAFPLRRLFTPEEREGLMQCGAHFGLLSKKRQLSELDDALSLLRDCVANDEKSLPTDRKLYRLLGVTAGLGFLIFMM